MTELQDAEAVNPPLAIDMIFHVYVGRSPERTVEDRLAGCIYFSVDAAHILSKLAVSRRRERRVPRRPVARRPVWEEIPLRNQFSLV